MPSNQSSHIAIIGAGISGLSLGLGLKQQGIAFVLYDRASQAPYHNYGITLRASSYRRLLPLLGLNETSFKKELAVDSGRGGVGRVPGAAVDSFRCHRGRLEALLRKNLSIEQNTELVKIDIHSTTNDKHAQLKSGDMFAALTFVACDGVHSVIRQSSSSMKTEVLPYVVINGKRRLTLSESPTILQHMGDATLCEKLHNETRLEISINDITTSHVDLSYTYSRPAKENDSTHRPNRPNSGAKDIPAEFFEELNSLRDLEPPFSDVFNVERIREDRLLHWLMRCVTPNADEVQQLAESSVILIGDAVHATPILGGEGANAAIQDALDLVEHISLNPSDNPSDNLTSFSKLKMGRWNSLVEESKTAIAKMHAG